MSLSDIKKTLKKGHVICNVIYTQNGTNENGYPTFNTDYEDKPLNSLVVGVVESLNIAILQDLDYIEPTE